MDLVSQAREGFQSIEAEAALKDQALESLSRWVTDPEFAIYQPQMRWLVEQRQWAGLLDRFYQVLPFGTGGRRGAVGVGPNRMNLWTLGASVQGHCDYLKERFPGVNPLHVVLAYDVRQFEDQRKQYNPSLPNPVLHLSSRDLAHHAVGIYVANGIHATTLPADSKRFLATPELSFLIRHLRAHGGLNISASHNPPDDNGGKFYDERGGQPVPPEDQIMADLVDQVAPARLRAQSRVLWADSVRTGRVHFLDDFAHQAYIDLCRKQSLVPPPRKDDFTVVFTPMHGVGAMTAMETLTAQGFRVLPVVEQMTPDGQFPHVTGTPNPEIPASMDRAADLAARSGADLALATDPDADRLGALIPDHRHRGWRPVTGNEIAALLTHFKLSKLAQQNRLPRSPIVITTEVTTRLVTRIARQFGAQVINNLLVGFKYIGEVLWQLEQRGAYEDVEGSPDDFVIACEESHGILVTARMRDKDAAGSALLLAELALDQKRKGQTVLAYLERLAREFGYFRNEGVPVFLRGVQGKTQMQRMLDRLRETPPREIAGLAVTAWEDLRNEEGRLGPLKGATDAASRNVLIFHLGEQAKVVLRPSGTEPKAKMYIEVCSRPSTPDVPDDVWQATCRDVDGQMRHITEAFVRHALGLIGLDPSAAGVR
jgi:phosphoglucomutase